MKVNWKDEEDNLRKMIDEGVSYIEIGKRYGVSYNAIKKAAKNLGIELKPRRKINPKETFGKGCNDITEICEQCGEEFTHPKYLGDVRFCSKKCKDIFHGVDSYILKEGEKIEVVKYEYARGKRVIRKCKFCGKIFETLAIKVRGGGELFCSDKCYKAHMKDNSMSENEARERHKLYQKKYKYGLTEEAYKDLFIKQNNKCAICGCEFDDMHKGFVDHSHKDGKVRGLLCTKCNTLLGMANDNINILASAITYLNEKQ